MADDFFAKMLAGDVASQFRSEIDTGNSDNLLQSLNIPTGTLTPEALANFEETTIGAAQKQLDLKKDLNDLVKAYFKILVKTAEEENKCRQQGLDFSQKLLELRADAAKAWATYEGEIQKLGQRTKNDINLIGYKAGKEVAHLQAVHPLRLQKEDGIYEKRFALAQAKHQTWMAKLRESISNAIAGINQNSQLQGQQQKVFGIFDGGKKRA